MNSQDFRNLQEAYLDVYDEGKVPWDDPKKPLESGHTPAEKNRAKRERTGVEDLSKSPTDKEYARYGDMKSVDDEQSSASKKNKSTHKFSDFPIDNKGKKQTVGQFRRTRGTPKPESRDEKSNLYQSPIHKDDKRTRGGRLDQWKGPNPRNEEIDIYDIILSHLLDEGYAETPESALAIMGNMSEDWRESICEGYKNLPRLRIAGQVLKKARRGFEGARNAINSGETKNTTGGQIASQRSMKDVTQAQNMINKLLPGGHNKEKAQAKETSNRAIGRVAQEDPASAAVLRKYKK